MSNTASAQQTTADQAAAFWDVNLWDRVPDRYWTSNPVLDEYVNTQIIEPRPGEGHLTWWIKKYLPGGVSRHMLSLACGGGHAERIALKSGVAHRATGYDISQGSLTHAREMAQQEGLGDQTTYEFADLNAPRFPAATFDTVIAFGCLHHIENLDALCREVCRTLQPDGLMYVNEYVGPNRFQYSDALLTEVNHIIAQLPEEATVRRDLVRMDPDAVATTDPSEAVRSADVVDVLCEHFDIVDGRNYGGGILYPLWAEVIEPAYFLQLKDPEIRGLLTWLCELDRTLTATGQIENLFMSYVVCPRGQAGNRTSTYNSQAAARDFHRFAASIA